VAAALNGRTVLEDGLVGFVSSAFDRFFNHLFATGGPALGEVEAALAGRPGFVWLCDDAAAAGARTGGGSRPVRVMHGMRATIRVPGVDERTPASITAVSSFDDLADWHAVYRGVFGVDPRSLDEWRRVHLALGPTGDDSLVLHLARVDGSAAATAAAFFDRNVVGLYSFTTRESMRGRGIASALIRASHAVASARGIEQALLQATPAARSVYARAGYIEERVLRVVTFP
jgi:GNAT superfamily N-acetyltransferase